MIAHLTAWQQVSIARLQAALRGTDPEYPDWLAGADPFFAEDHVDQFNARIRELYRDRPWSSVHRAWREGFLRFVELGETIPEDEMLDAGRYPWLKGHALSAVLQGSCEHHHEHYESLSARLG